MVEWRHDSPSSEKVFHPDLLLNEAYKECHPFFKSMVAAGGDIVFLPWPKGKDFKKELRKAFPGESADFYKRFHHVGGLPEGQPEDIWMKDYLVFCENGDRCTLLSSTDKDPATKAPEALETAWKKRIQTTFEGRGLKVSWVPPKCNRQIEKGMGSLSCVTGACPSPVRKAIQAEEKKENGDH